MLYTACPEKYGCNHYLESNGSNDIEYIGFISYLTLINNIFSTENGSLKASMFKDAFGNIVWQDMNTDRLYISDSALKPIELGAYKSNSIWLDDGKYIVVRNDNNTAIEILRYGDKWRYDLIGDNVIYHLCCLIDELYKKSGESNE